jgi:hypothetical protein
MVSSFLILTQQSDTSNKPKKKDRLKHVVWAAGIFVTCHLTAPAPPFPVQLHHPTAFNSLTPLTGFESTTSEPLVIILYYIVLLDIYVHTVYYILGLNDVQI